MQEERWLIRFEAASLTSPALEEDHWAASSYRTWVRKVCYLPGGSGSVGLSKSSRSLPGAGLSDCGWTQSDDPDSQGQGKLKWKMGP